jgi:GTP-binding protein
MKILTAEFVSSVADVKKCPPPNLNEFAFIGRSNVGKSSLINMLTNRKGLAKTSAKPGKTQTINHFIINDQWYLVDLPGYGYASVSKSLKAGFGRIIDDYVLKRENLDCLFILLDARLEPQKNDLSFMTWSGSAQVPIALVFTKTDKLSTNALTKNIKHYESVLLQSWTELPPIFITSSTTQRGKEELLNFIETVVSNSAENK